MPLSGLNNFPLLPRRMRAFEERWSVVTGPGVDNDMSPVATDRSPFGHPGALCADCLVPRMAVMDLDMAELWSALIWFGLC